MGIPSQDGKCPLCFHRNDEKRSRYFISLRWDVPFLIWVLFSNDVRGSKGREVQLIECNQGDCMGLNQGLIPDPFDNVKLGWFEGRINMNQLIRWARSLIASSRIMFEFTYSAIMILEVPSLNRVCCNQCYGTRATRQRIWKLQGTSLKMSCCLSHRWRDSSGGGFPSGIIGRRLAELEPKARLTF